MAITPRVEIRYNFSNEGVTNNIILHYRPSAQPADPAAWAGEVGQYLGEVQTVTRNCITAETTFLGVDGRYIDLAQSFDFTAQAGNTLGVVAGDTCPAEIAAIIRKKGIGPSKRANGTVFFPCVPEAFTNGSDLTNDAMGTYQAWHQIALDPDGPVGGTWKPVVMSRTANTLFDIFLGQVVRQVGGQRRRRYF